MKSIFLTLLVASLFLLSCTNNKKIDFKSKSFQISINMQGEVCSFIDLKTKTNHIFSDSLVSLMSVKIGNDIIASQSAELKEDILTLKYSDDLSAQIKVKQQNSFITFELLSISDIQNVDLIIWGPYPTTINKVIGETVGVVQGDEFAIGIQALNPKTLGGYPWRDNDCLPQIDIFDQEDKSDMTENSKKRYVLYRVEAAKPTDFGSSLQAYCRNRSEDRIIENWGHEKYFAPAYDDGGVIGSKIALFGAPKKDALKIIGEIEIAENLPHPLIDGEWAKTSPLSASSYLIMDFGENDIDEAIEITKKAGLNYLYHSGPFVNWGHFDLDEKSFPNGVAGMKDCVEKAEKEDIKLGLHTLSNFITTDDPYVTPVPDKRLAIVGSSELSEEINKSQTEIPIKSPDFFNQYKNNHLKTVRIDNELIRYSRVSESAPWKLLDCQRGAHKTTAEKHSKGEEISKLTDHAYKVFLTNTELSIEMSENIADLYNETGLRQISFDGLEGNISTAMGNYGESLFAIAWYDKLNENVKSHFIADASRTTHYFWHIYTRMNWGEPWYAGFRESQTTDRLRNQEFFKRNLMPSMLGWFLLKPETSIEDVEWLLARSAAFNAGFAFVVSQKTLAENGNSDKILQIIGEWEKLRIAESFSEEQKEKMEDISNEFTLEKVNDNEWNLIQVYSSKFNHEMKVRQPGEPLYSTFNFTHFGDNNSLHFILSAVDGDVSDIIMEIDNYKEIKIPVVLKMGEHIKYIGGKKASVYDKNWKLINEFDFDSSLANITDGEHSVTVDCKFDKQGNKPMLKLELRTFGVKELVKLKQQ